MEREMEERDWRDALNREFERVMGEREVPPRRRQVAQRVLRGYPDKDIAADMAISVDAVKKHKRRLYDAFCVHDRGGFAKTVWQLMGDEPPVSWGTRFGDCPSRVLSRPACRR